MSELNRPRSFSPQAGWRTKLALALSLMPGQLGVASHAVHAEPGRFDEMMRDEQVFLRDERESKEKSDARKLAGEFALKRASLAEEEGKLKIRFKTFEERQQRLKGIINERDSAGLSKGTVEERMLEDEAGEGTIEMLDLLEWIRKKYPDPSKMIEQFTEERDRDALKNVRRITEIIEKMLQLPGTLKDQQILLELLLTPGSD
ncbi:MAG: hypothetical protein G01um10148_395 [Parcubacteria group bacterium Gr01-1014_8]|nr:MAG: hypothetical protein G01um10148_395 [Parcubacteria group bacterium Gr01-1014_8]